MLISSITRSSTSETDHAIAFSVIGFFYVKHRGKGKVAAAFIPVVLDEPEEEKKENDKEEK